MDKAITSMQDEVSELVATADQVQTQLEASIGDLSDLRYGKLSRPGLRKEVIESLKTLAAECDRKGAGDVDLQGR
jgi:centromere-localized protein 2